MRSTDLGGSGKGSAVNLVLHHLKDAIDANEVAVINFACWWFRGEEELALAFFRELYAGLGATLGDCFKRVLPIGSARACYEPEPWLGRELILLAAGVPARLPPGL